MSEKIEIKVSWVERATDHDDRLCRLQEILFKGACRLAERKQVNSLKHMNNESNIESNV